MHVRHRDRAGTYDRHCRFPGCHRPAARCQIDHVIPFDHANPLGGWTTVNNLQCLCEYHHSVKNRRPHIPTQPRRSGVIAYAEPPDNLTPEPSDEEADTAPAF
ncbi:HNH endonuclease signature motif containing protein [Rhodococcoides fascians]|uniref:HNH endonuclease signature motif containing protein n=1 Tax=Rhodococcoides fascians TaxID=1828 RepID=UPI003521BA2D